MTTRSFKEAIERPRSGIFLLKAVCSGFRDLLEGNSFPNRLLSATEKMF